MKQKSFIYPLIFAALLSVGIILGGWLTTDKTGLQSQNASKQKLNRLIDFIDNEYVDDVNTDSIVDITVNSLLAKLDRIRCIFPKMNSPEQRKT